MLLIQTQQQFDVIVYGATISGITAAITYAQNGVRVALVDSDSIKRDHDRLDYANPTARQLLRSVLLQESIPIVPGKLELWTRWGWIRPDKPELNQFVHHGELRDQLLKVARFTSGLTLYQEAKVENILKNGEDVIGIQIQEHTSERPLKLLARLVVMADRPNSHLNSLLNLKPATLGRMYYHTFYELSGMPRAQFWLLDPDVAAIVAHGKGLTEVIYSPAPQHLAAFQQDPEGSLTLCLAQLPEAPQIPNSTRISRVFGPVAADSSIPDANYSGLVTIGPAKLSLPLFRANQMGMDLQSAFWLVENTLQALMVTGEIEGALRAYRQQHQQATRAYRQHNDQLASGRSLNKAENLVLSAAANHPAAATRLFGYLNQTLVRGQVLRPGTFIQALRSNPEPAPAKPLSAPQSP